MIPGLWQVYVSLIQPNIYTYGQLSIFANIPSWMKYSMLSSINKGQSYKGMRGLLGTKVKGAPLFEFEL